MGKHEHNCKDAILLSPQERKSYDVFFKNDHPDNRSSKEWRVAVEKKLAEKQKLKNISTFTSDLQKR